MYVVKKVVKTDYYGHCNVRLNNVSNPCPVWVVHNGKKVFEQLSIHPGGGWQFSCVDVPIMPGTNEIYVKTNYLFWQGKNYTSVGVQPKELCKKANITSLKEAINRGVVSIKGPVFSCSKAGIVVLNIKDRTVWGGSPYYNSCAATYARGSIVVVTPKTVKMYYVVGNRLHQFNDLSSHVDYENSYVILCSGQPSGSPPGSHEPITRITNIHKCPEIPGRDCFCVQIKRFSYATKLLFLGVQNISDEPVEVTLIVNNIKTKTLEKGQIFYDHPPYPSLELDAAFCIKYENYCKIKVLAGELDGGKIKWTDYRILEFGKEYIDRSNTYLIINGKKCPPGKYDVYAGTKIPFKVTLFKPATIQVYDKQSGQVLWSGSGKIVTGNLTVNKSCQIEFMVECGGKIVDKYG